ncbi:Rieske (2Fe-2S) protein [Arthrobacter sp. CAN_A214]|uniref:Rieske (2Fe-2S) protein n=1 Tax=Arthrobacter sp. CAN_A214 TaxID=2787720 RepID=UPI0018CAAF5E
MTGPTHLDATGSAPVSTGALPVPPDGTEAVPTVLGPADQVPIGEGRAFAVGGEQIAVFHLRDGTFRARSAVCTHRGGPIADGTIDQRVVMCPLHQNVFELDTGCSTTGAPPLKSYTVHVNGVQNIVLQFT